MSNEDNYVKPPSFLEMVKNFKDDATEFIKRGAPVMDSAGYATRLGVCNACEHLIRKSMRCGACGCLVEGKAKMQTSRCPMGKWENGKKSNNPETKVHQNGKK
tara:strand:+ start:337 stop:645 length:309 start_codon:yes stop_codon:yes gene_type:complete